MTRPPHLAMNFRQVLPGLYRSGNLKYLSPRGRTELLQLGLARIIDLRNRAERQKDPPAFVGRPEYLNLPLLPYRNRDLNKAIAEATGNADIAMGTLKYAPSHIVSVLGALLDAPPGPVLVHCHAGKDRTGLIVALCLTLAGKTREEIAADYVMTGPQLLEFYAEMKTRKTPEDWARLEPFEPSHPDDVLRPLAYLDREWKGPANYLAMHGFSEKEQAALALRFRGLTG